MRKQTKIAALVSATALLALGASITSFAAKKGTWMMVDGEWYCYDSNGDVIENEFCLSNGKEYYVGDDGQLVRSDWVEYDGDYYFVNSSGAKITNDWRLTTPYDDSSSDEEWFYFQSTGKRAEDKKLLIKGSTYFFNGDGEMMTGWVQASGDSWDEGSTDDVKGTETYYCDEETGARLESTWVLTYAPSVDEDDADDDDLHYYYLKSSGKAATGKQSNVKGQTYFFDEEGVMLSGWVTRTSSNAGYVQIWEDDDDSDGYYSTSLSEFADADVYFCGESDDGHMKKGKWIKTWNNVDYGADDDDNDKYWFYINNSGKVYIPDTAGVAATRYKLEDGEGNSFDDRFTESNYDVDGDNLTVSTKKINSKTYFFDANGQMMSKFVYVTATNSDIEYAGMYYFGTADDGARKDGSVSVTDESGESHRFYFATETNTNQHYYNAVGINGAKSGKLYDNGLLLTAEDAKYEVKTVTIDGSDYDFIVNKSGSIQSSKKEYEEDDDVLVDASEATFSDTKGATYKSVTGLK